MHDITQTFSFGRNFSNTYGVKCFSSVQDFWYIAYILVFREIYAISFYSDWTRCPLSRHINVANFFESDCNNNLEL